MVSVGTIVWLSSELMFFAGLFAMYFTIRSVSPGPVGRETANLNVPFATANTLVLVISSVCVPDRRVQGRARPAGRTGSLLQVASGACASGTC